MSFNLSSLVAVASSELNKRPDACCAFTKCHSDFDPVKEQDKEDALVKDLEAKGHTCIYIGEMYPTVTMWCEQEPCANKQLLANDDLAAEQVIQDALVKRLTSKGHSCFYIDETYPSAVWWCEQDSCANKELEANISTSITSFEEKVYPNLTKFAEEYLVPYELRSIADAVAKVCVQNILKALNDNDYDTLTDLIKAVSPFPGYLDDGADAIFDSTYSQIEESGLGEKLHSALAADDVAHVLPIDD